VSRLRVALDGRPLQSSPLGGVGRYLEGMISAMDDDVELVVLLNARRPEPARLDGDIERVRLSAPPGVPGLGWLELAVAPWLRRFGGVFHGAFNVLPLSFRGRAVLTLHDLAPQLHPEDFRPLVRTAWRGYIRASVARARVITTVSGFSRRQIAEHFRLDPERVLVAPDALDPRFEPERGAGAQEVARAHGIEPPYVIAVGGASRRGVEVALEAWRRTRGEHGLKVGLAVTRERRLPSEPGLVALGSLDDETWATLLAGASALCYPTRYEGFGLPALEALASGTPVVCNRVASLPEVLGDAACWTAGPSAEDFARVLVRLLADRAWHRERREAGLAQAAAATSWPQTAAVLRRAFELAAR
jgi:glycosyltransferase involved in cell wall biosynthesis